MNMNMRWRILLVLGTIAVAMFFLWPSWNYYRLSADEIAAMDPNQLEEQKAQALRLGLDLQGGMHVVLELDDSDVDESQDTSDLMDRALEVIRNRVDQFGVSEPVVQRASGNRIIVELAGIDDYGRARDLLSKAAVLEFKMVRPGSEVRRLVDRLDRELARAAGVTTSEAEDAAADAALDAATDAEETAADGVETATTDAAIEEAGDIVADATDAADETIASIAEYLRTDVEATAGRPLSSRITISPRQGRIAVNEVCYVSEADFDRVDAYITFLADSTRAIPNDVQFSWGSEVLTDGAGNQLRNLFLLNRRPELTGETLEDARPLPDTNSNIGGNYLVQFDLSRKGRRLFSRTTGENVGKLMAIVLDDRVKSAPEIESKIRGGTASITGSFQLAEAQDLSVVLRAGALPLPIRFEEQRAVGPSLGHDSIELGRKAIMFGFVGVLIFMLIYYRVAGVVAVFALFMNLLLMLAALVSLGAVLTLPGIAGFVLTVGMAVDANVLIFERIREELRAGQTFRNALSRGYDRAFRTIFDANLTTLFASLALLWFGTGPIKGFAVTLSIGIVVSMFTALFVTRVLFDLLTRKAGASKIPV